MISACMRRSLWGEGKLPDERKRSRPKVVVVEQGLHPHPGPSIYDGGFDDPDGGEWDNHEPGWSDDEADDEEGDWLPSNASLALDGEQVRQEIEEMAWKVLMQPPAADTELRDYLGGIGCPIVDCDTRPNLKHKVWHTPGAEEEDEVRPALAGESSDEELWQALDVADDEVVDPGHDTDEELGFVDWYDARHGRCRGEMEMVLGTEAWTGDRVAWALNTGMGSMVVDPSVHKQDRRYLVDQETDETDERDECKPGFWDRADGCYKRHDDPPRNVFSSGDGSQKQQEPDAPVVSIKWKPMSAAKIREAARQDEHLKKQRCRKAAAETREDTGAVIWREAFSCDQPLPLDEAAELYAGWVDGGRQGEDAKESVFEACKDYKYRVGGPKRCKRGWVLKTGALGFGYYKDGVPEQRALQLHELLWPTERLAPVKLCLDEMINHEKTIGDPLLATVEEHDDGNPRRKKSRRQKRNDSRRVKTLTAVESMADEATVNLRDKSHRDRGWWAIDTANPNAWGGAAEILESSAADAIALQETRVPKEGTKDHENIARNAGWNLAISACGYGQAGGESSGVAVGCRKHIGLAESCEDADLPEELRARFTAKHIGAVCKGGFHLCSGYLHTAVGIGHKLNLDWLQAAAGVLSTLKGPWILAADFNCTPQQLTDTGWLAVVGGVIFAPNQPTCKNRVIDFFVVSANLAGMVAGAVTVGDALCKPHSPVRLYLKADARTMVVRTLKKIGKLPAVLPHGPALRHDDLGDLGSITQDERYEMFISRMEKEAINLMALDEKAAKRFMGRTEGPKFVQRNALEDGQGGTRRTTAVSRAWRRTAGWLDVVENTNLILAEEAAMLKILTYRHPEPPVLKATPEQIDGFKRFRFWRKQLTREMLGYKVWASALKKAAIENAEKEEKAAQHASLLKWTKWIHEGPADGLRRQHKFSRTVKGWTPTAKSTGVTPDIDQEDELEDLDGISTDDLNAIRFNQASTGTPATAQQEADDEAQAWGKIWGEGTRTEELKWPSDMGDDLPAILVEELLEAARTFPVETGLGWDQWHPMVVLRLSYSTLLLLVTILMECERTGEWPAGVALVLIALLPKTDGGFRPIGLLPSPPRLWMRVRRRAARRWEELNERKWLYAGKAKGANVAAWKQAFFAEYAATMGQSAVYVQTLLDLVKAFDRVPLWLLVREAIALGYPLKMLRLSIAAYQLKRVIRVGAVVSRFVSAVTGITAGSGFATSEMRLVMIRVIDRALTLYPTIMPTLFVDDLAAAVCAPTKLAIDQMGGFIEYVAEFIVYTGQALSPTKSNVTASCRKVGEALVTRWKKVGIVIHFQLRVKALGVGMGAGVRRNTTVMRSRLANFACRMARFRRLRKVGVSTARLMRTGMRAITYCSAIMGVPCGLLKTQRQTAAAVSAPGAGTGGQNMDLALVVADGSKKGRADPAYDAHSLPIGEWAMAIWEGWTSISSLQCVVKDATARIEKATSKWSVCYGPGAAFVLTCARLKWTISSATVVITDVGEVLNMVLDPPRVVVMRCYESVQRWRWRRVEASLPQLAANGTGRGPIMEPIWQLLRTDTKEEGWNATHKGCLRSAIPNRQFPQTRVKSCGWSQHDRCLMCLSTIVDNDDVKADGTQQQQQKQKMQQRSSRTFRDEVVATAEQIGRAPKGDLIHRIWSCKHTDPLRTQFAREADVRAARQLESRGHPTWERGLTPRPTLPLKKRSKSETFNWHVKPRDGIVYGDVYPDGSARDGPIPELVRLGWAFVVVDDSGTITAAAYGVPPPWIVDIGGAEAWGLYQSMLHTVPQLSRYWPDCYPVKLAVEKGAKVALDPRNALARIHGLLHTALDEDDGRNVGWMPAHLTKADLALGTATKSDGSLVTARDIWANDVADKLAKQGVEVHRVPREEVSRWKATFRAAKARAKWVGIATQAAGNHAHFPFRDSEASRWKAVAAQRNKAAKKTGADGRRRRVARPTKRVIPAAKGGHLIVRAMTGRGWVCTKCKARSASKVKLATSRCEGGGKQQQADGGRRHVMVVMGTVLWCDTCGAYTESRTSRRMRDVCPGPPPRSAGKGGMRQQLMALKAGRHPVTGLRLPDPSSSMVDRGIGTYSRLKVTASDRQDMFVPYEPREIAVPRPSGISAERKRILMLGRLRCKMGREVAILKRRRRREAKCEAREVIRSFINGASDEEDRRALSSDHREGNAADDEDCEAFWANLPVDVSREQHIRDIPNPPMPQVRGIGVRTTVRRRAIGREERSLPSRRCMVLNCFHFGCDGGHA